MIENYWTTTTTLNIDSFIYIYIEQDNIIKIKY